MTLLWDDQTRLTDRLGELRVGRRTTIVAGLSGASVPALGLLGQSPALVERRRDLLERYLIRTACSATRAQRQTETCPNPSRRHPVPRQSDSFEDRSNGIWVPGIPDPAPERLERLTDARVRQ